MCVCSDSGCEGSSHPFNSSTSRLRIDLDDWRVEKPSVIERDMLNDCLVEEGSNRVENS